MTVLDPHIFDATVRDNLRLARPEAGDAELAAAADRARLPGWIGSLPRGWGTQVGTPAADLLAATAGRSTRLITHDLEGLGQADEIVALERGRVAERGTHAQLVRSDGVYHRLWQAGQEVRA